MAAFPVTERLRGLPPVMQPRNLQISGRNIELMNRTMRLHESATVSAPGGINVSGAALPGGRGGQVDVSA